MSSGSENLTRVRNIVIAVGVIALVVIVFALRGRGRGAVSGDALAPPAGTAAPTAEGTDRPGGPAEGGDASAAAARRDDPLARRWRDLIGSDPRWPDDLSSPQDCQEVERALEDVSRALDAQPGVAELIGDSQSYAMVIEVSEALAARPPEPGSELRSHGTTVANVYHLFRVLGRERISVARKLIADQEDLSEPGALALYRWLISREACAGTGGTEIRLESLYDYATYIFTTLGGQAYLRRRPPLTEALTCFFALQVLDVAIEQRHNPHGVDPRPEIARCRGLLASQDLVFRQQYIDQLDRMAQRWGRGRSGG